MQVGGRGAKLARVQYKYTLLVSVPQLHVLDAIFREYLFLCSLTGRARGIISRVGCEDVTRTVTLLIKQCRDFPRPGRLVVFGGGSLKEPVSVNNNK
jgi:hypothetical protein